MQNRNEENFGELNRDPSDSAEIAFDPGILIEPMAGKAWI
jgi:hypothetical protein